MSGSSDLIPVHTSTHFPTMLSQNNFAVWRTQIMSVLTGLGLLGYIDGTVSAPSQFLTADKPNPAFITWNRQDKYILGALLGSYHETIQPLISTANTAKQMWDQLVTLFANKSRSRIMSLKTHLMNNPCNARNMSDYLRDIRITADELAIAGQPVSDDDLVILTLSGLGDEYRNIKDVMSVREAPLTFGALHEQLIDYERVLKSKASEPVIVTANYTHKPLNHNRSTQSAQRGRGNYNPNRYQQQSFNRQHGTSPTYVSGNRPYCRFCQRSRHDTKECRQLSRFLKDNGIQTPSSVPRVSPSVNATSTHSSQPQQWLFDTGASHHITNDPANLTTYSDYGGPDEILLGNGSGLPITHTGTSQLVTPKKSLKLSNVLCVPSLQKNLVSVAKFCLNNHVSVEFFPSQFLVKDLNTGAILLCGENKNDVYYASHQSIPQVHATECSSLGSWHHRLGHPHTKIFRCMLESNKLVSNIPSDFSLSCHSCLCNKSRKLPFGVSSMSSSKPLDLIYSDVWGPTITSSDGYRYYVIFVDHFTRYIWLYPLKNKSDVKDTFILFKNIVEKFFQRSIISLYSDNGGEYIALKSFLQANVISHFTSPPHTPEHNGFAERRHGHIVQTGRTLMHHANLPLKYWSYAFETAVYLINRMPTKTAPHMSPLSLCLIKNQITVDLKYLVVLVTPG